MTDIINDINNIIIKIKDNKKLIVYLQNQLNILHTNNNPISIEYNLKLVDWNNVNNL
jgi:hypothetical protein